MHQLYKKLFHKHLVLHISGFWLLGTISGVLQIFQIILISELLNHVKEKQGDTIRLFYAICICFFSYIFIKSINERFINTSVNHVNRELRKQIGRKNNRMKLANLEGYGQGKIISIITNDVDDIGKWQKSLFLIGNTMTKLIGGLGFSIYMSWEITVILIPFAFLSVLLPILYLKSLEEYHRKEREKSNSMNKKLIDSIHFLNIIKTYCLERYFGEDNKKILDEDGKIRKKISKKSEIGYRMGVIIGHINTAVIILSGVYLIIKGIIGVGELFGVIMIAGVIGEGINELLTMLPNYQSGKVSLQRISELLNSPEHRMEGTDTAVFNGKADIFCVEHLSFGYGDKKILEDISFHITKGEKIAVVGPSGSGKTTLFKLLCGMYELEENKGNILLMGKHLRETALPEVAANIAVMPQDTYLFAGSIKENIVLNSNAVNEAKLEECCSRLSIRDMIEKHEGGYAAKISSLQKNMSKGQVQRLGLARVLYHDKEIMLLDEPTSALDYKLSKRVTEELLKTDKNMTLILIAHKLHEPSDFDRIMVLHNGRVAGFAHHDILLRECNIYQELIQNGLVENWG